MPPWFEAVMTMEDTLLGRVVATILTIVAIWLLRWLVLSLVQPRLHQAQSRFLWRKSTTYVAIGVALWAIGSIWLSSGFGGIAAFLGLATAGLAVALRDWIANFFGWLYIITWRPYTIGDRVEIGGVAGDVIDVGLLATSMLEIGNWVQADQSTGRLLHVPNGHIMTKSLANYTSGMHYIWHELRVVVTYESHWRDAKSILSEIAERICEESVADAEVAMEEASKKWLIHYQRLTPMVYTQIDHNGVALTLRYLTKPRQRRSTDESLWEAILDAFGERDDIEFAYTTHRFFDRETEGKASTRGSSD